MSLAMRFVLLFALARLLYSARGRGSQTMGSAQAPAATPGHRRNFSLFYSLVIRRPLSGLFMPKNKSERLYHKERQLI
jgi:hypothetical protein